MSKPIEEMTLDELDNELKLLDDLIDEKECEIMHHEQQQELLQARYDELEKTQVTR